MLRYQRGWDTWIDPGSIYGRGSDDDAGDREDDDHVRNDVSERRKLESELQTSITLPNYSWYCTSFNWKCRISAILFRNFHNVQSTSNLAIKSKIVLCIVGSSNFPIVFYIEIQQVSHSHHWNSTIIRENGVQILCLLQLWVPWAYTLYIYWVHAPAARPLLLCLRKWTGTFNFRCRMPNKRAFMIIIENKVAIQILNGKLH